MPVTKVLHVYGTKSLLSRWVFVPTHDDSEIDGMMGNIIPGESHVLVPIETYRDVGAAGLQALVGMPTISGRCAVVDENNNVIDAILADPDLHKDQRGKLISHDLAIKGDIWDGEKFTRKGKAL